MSLISDTEVCIHVININIRYLKSNLDEIKIMLDLENCIDIFGVCETFLNKTVDDSFLHIDGYRFLRKDRDDTSKGGGLLIYIREHIKYIIKYIH